MRTTFIIFILSFLVACSSNENGETSIPSRERLHKKRVRAKNNTVVGKSVKVISHPPKIDPFLTKDEESSTGRYDRLLTLNLSAVFYSPPDSKVIIDGRILKKGDIIDNKTVKEIRPDAVILKDPIKEYIVEMKNNDK